ncbi:alpha/beta fold hydrolase [Rhodoplanes sp. TEM]|uniref:Alpha/beta fold hydrolase n=1 Tax=Rhodoplanes tepidamans TaxID=200616 RepID=A0ABT5JCP6_RHOTP|nr:MULTISPECIES: alpha/beta fold hydrolase [Rhodoplanes]MDC7787039.1 alpha/beta fold hydrolase [Rhodoplanes tepidamans]MDC7985263.1 alpha/beta fold hydrolase [Rhodoplanes sp. TEM]MDQ0354234.1 surfactin synthase thioesterase subunit [Rhodoplanes tepidamans]
MTVPPCLPYRCRKPLAALDLICFHYAGGNAAVFRRWDERLPAWISVRPIELPGHGARMGEPPLADPEALVAQLAAELIGAQHRPFALLGHSFGAALAFRVALAAERAGRPPAHLFVSGRHAPSFAGRLRPRIGLSDAALLAELRFLGGTPDEALASTELMALMGPIIRADFVASELMTRAPRTDAVACPLDVIGADDDQEVDHRELDRWRAHTTGAFTLTVMPGRHFFIHDSVDAICRIVVDRLSPRLGPSGRPAVAHA